MATGSSTAGNTTTVSTTTSSSNNNNNNTTTAASGGLGASSSNTTTLDAATVAIAKDMLQLHHSNNNNNNSNSGNTGSASGNGGISIQTNNNNNDNQANDTTIIVDNIEATTVTGTSPATNNRSNAAEQPHSIITTTSPQLNLLVSTTTPPPTRETTTTAGSMASSSSASLVNASNSNNSNSISVANIPENALGYLKCQQDLLYIFDTYTVIGRNSSTSHVHFHVNENNLVSRKHFQLIYEPETRDFYVQCLSKNGIFVDDFLHRRNADPLKLPASCYFRFPSTEIRIQFESFVHNYPVSMSSAAVQDNHHLQYNQQQQHHRQSQHQQQQQQRQHHIVGSSNNAHLLTTIDNANAAMYSSPLKISIPNKKEQKSPYLSPTGTISAANSCPASPRQNYHTNQTNYNNYANNNIQNQELFQTPATASYNHNEKPPYSYAQLIVQAISAAPDKQLTLSGIYSFIVKHYPYYRKETNKGWQNSIRHNLSLNRYFIKVARSQDEPGKGSFWRIDPDSGAKLIDHSYKKRRQRSSQGFRPSYGMPRSAPVSPSHMDNSRESSPLQDIVLQSAPGSPGMSIENRVVEGDIIYGSQNQTTVHNSQYNGSPIYITTTTTNQNSGQQQQQQQQTTTNIDNSNIGNGNAVGALMALKRNHAMAAGAAAAAVAAQQHQQQVRQQQLQHTTIATEMGYDELPTDYSGNMAASSSSSAAAAESSSDEVDSAKRPKYISEVL